VTPICPICRRPLEGNACTASRQHGSVWRCRRASLGLTVCDVAAELGCEPATLHRAEDGVASDDELRRLADLAAVLRRELRRHVHAAGQHWSEVAVPAGWTTADVRQAAREVGL
jgi:transcriptional regulator with XRE-family HTH domain